MFYIIRCDGVLEAWDLLDRTHEPSLTHTVSTSALTKLSIKIEGKKQYLAVGDMHGILKVLLVSQFHYHLLFLRHTLDTPSTEDLWIGGACIDGEIRGS